MTEYRVCHDAEYQFFWRKNVPEVYNFGGILGATNLTRAWQQLIMALNPGMTGHGFRSLLAWDRAFTNGSGFDQPGRKPRADFINGLNTRAKLPRLDKVRVCGGAVLHGKKIGDTLIVETLNGRKKPPAIDWLLDHPWLYFRAVTVLPDSSIAGSIADFPQNNGKPVYMPLVSSGVTTVRLYKAVLVKPIPYVVDI